MTELALDHKGCTVTKTEDLAQLMRARFCPPEWALFFEIQAGTGWVGMGGRADAVALNLYPSQGLTINGFEMKVSRADWLKEMKDHAKAETIFGFCDHWWLVVGDRSIVKEGELPEPWGLIAPRGDGLAVVKKAPRLKAKPITREFIAVLARRANQAATEAIADRIALATREIEGRQERRVKQARDEASERHRLLAAKVLEFEAASGIDIQRGYEGGARIGEAVKHVLRGGLEKQREEVSYALNRVNAIAEDLRGLMAVLPEKKAGGAA